MYEFFFSKSFIAFFFLLCIYILHLLSFSLQCGQSELDAETVKSILAEYKIHNADITVRSDSTADDLIDVVEGNRWAAEVSQRAFLSGCGLQSHLNSITLIADVFKYAVYVLGSIEEHLFELCTLV